MIYNLKLTKVKEAPFQGSDGETVPYFWVKGEKQDGLTIEFGTTVKPSVGIGETADFELEKYEVAGGKFRYKELV